MAGYRPQYQSNLSSDGNSDRLIHFGNTHQPFSAPARPPVSPRDNSGSYYLHRRLTNHAMRPPVGRLSSTATRPPSPPTRPESYVKRDVLHHFEDLHAERVSVQPREALALRCELALFPCPAPLRHRRRRSRVDADSFPIGLRSRVSIISAMADGWDGSSVNGQCDRAWSLDRQRRRLEQRMDHLETGERSLQEEIEKLRIHKEAFSVEKAQLAILQETLELETLRLKENQQALESQHSTLRNRLQNVNNMKLKLEDAHARLKRKFEYAKSHSEQIVKSLRRGDREKLRVQFARKSALRVTCKLQVEAVHKTLEAFTKAAETKKKSLASMGAELAEVPPLSLPLKKRDILLRAIRETLSLDGHMSVPAASSDKTELISAVLEVKHGLEFQIRREREFGARLDAIRYELEHDRARAVTARGNAKRELDHWKKVRSSATSKNF